MYFYRKYVKSKKKGDSKDSTINPYLLEELDEISYFPGYHHITIWKTNKCINCRPELASKKFCFITDDFINKGLRIWSCDPCCTDIIRQLKNYKDIQISKYSFIFLVLESLLMKDIASSIIHIYYQISPGIYTKDIC